MSVWSGWYGALMSYQLWQWQTSAGMRKTIDILKILGPTSSHLTAEQDSLDICLEHVSNRTLLDILEK